MIEMQPRSHAVTQPPRERLAYLLAQLSELDPEPDKRLKPILARGLKLEPVPARKAAVKQEAAAIPAPPAAPAKKQVPRQKRRPAAKPKPEPGGSSFHAVFRATMKKRGVTAKKEHPEPGILSRLEFRPKGPLGGLARAWAWLQSKYTNPASRRLRLSEMVPLGDRRFVALLRVEDREFLVGGSTSGVSLLAQLGLPQPGTTEPGATVKPQKRRKPNASAKGRSQ